VSTIPPVPSDDPHRTPSDPYRTLAGDQPSEAERQARTERLVDAIFAPNGTHERTHERTHDSDCFACDLAAEIAGSIAASVHFGTRVRTGRTETDGWALPATLDCDDANPNDTRLDLAYRLAAHNLHKKLPGHQTR